MKSYGLLLLLATLPMAHADTLLNLSWTPSSNLTGVPTSVAIDLATYQDEGSGDMGVLYENDSDTQFGQVLIGSERIWASGLSDPYAILYSFYMRDFNGNLLDVPSGTTISFTGSELAADYVGSGFQTVGLSGQLTVEQSGSFRAATWTARRSRRRLF